MFRTLSLDGGGIKGTFRASALAALEEETQMHPVSERKRSKEAPLQTAATLAESVGQLATHPRSGKRGYKTWLTDDEFRKGRGPLGARM